MTKKLLLAGIALGALTMAGAASAHELSFRAAGPAGAITSGDTNTLATGSGVAAETDLAVYGRSLVGLYLIAEESTTASLGNGVLALTDVINGGSGSIPSGNNVYTITLSDNAVFGTNVGTGVFASAPGCTFVPSTGGGALERTVTFLVSATGATCNTFNLNLPVTPTGAGTVTVTTTIETEAGNPIDGGTASLDAIFAINAFQPAINGTVGTTAGASADTRAELPTYTTLSGDPILGRLAIYVDTRANRTLNPSAGSVVVGDVADADVLVEGNFSAFDGSTLPQLCDNLVNGGAVGSTTDAPGACVTSVAANVTASSVLFPGIDGFIVETLASKPNGKQFRVTPDNSAIQGSDYTATISYALGVGFRAQSDLEGSFERIERDGTNVTLPWMNSSNTGASMNRVRIGNLAGAPARVSAEVRNSTASGYTNPGVVFLTTLPGNGEVQLSTTDLTTALGQFGRGDVTLVVEAAPTNITVRRYNISSNGITEVDSGTVAQDQQ